jgi:hypothetical protein
MSLLSSAVTCSTVQELLNNLLQDNMYGLIFNLPKVGMHFQDDDDGDDDDKQWSF